MSKPTTAKKKFAGDRRKLSNGTTCSIQDALNSNAFKNDSYFITEPAIQTPISMPTLNSVKSTRESTAKKPDSALSNVASPHAFETTTPLYNRKVVKGYGKFLEERGFISQREDARMTVQKDIKKSFANVENKIVNKDIQNLITATIVNHPNNRPQTVLKQLTTNGEDDQMDKYFERYKKVANRVLGTDYDNNHLFVKVQKENITSGKPKRINTAVNTSYISTATDSTAKYKDYVASISKSIGGSALYPREARKNKNSFGLVASTLNELTRQTTENYDESKLATDHGEPLYELHVPSVTSIDDDLHEKFDSFKPDPLSELPPIIDFTSQMRSVSQPESTKIGKSLLLKDRNSDYHNLLNKSTGKTKVKKSSNSEIFEQNLMRNKRANISKIKKPNNIRIPSLDENGQEPVKSNRVIRMKNSSLNGVNNISNLCDGAIKTTNRLVLKLRQQSVEVGKQYGKIDTEYEKMKWDNTTKNWELSVKHADGLKTNF